MGIISWIIVGLIAGALGKMILPGDDPGGFIVTILIGMAGALVGGDRGHGVQHLVHPRGYHRSDRTACRLPALADTLVGGAGRPEVTRARVIGRDSAAGG